MSEAGTPKKRRTEPARRLVLTLDGEPCSQEHFGLIFWRSAFWRECRGGDGYWLVQCWQEACDGVAHRARLEKP